MTAISAMDEWDWWIGSWRSLITCGECLGLMHFDRRCPVCGKDYHEVNSEPVQINGKEVWVPQRVHAGAMNFTEFVLLKLMFADWKRPLTTENPFGAGSAGDVPSPRLLIVILY